MRQSLAQNWRLFYKNIQFILQYANSPGVIVRHAIRSMICREIKRISGFSLIFLPCERWMRRRDVRTLVKAGSKSKEHVWSNRTVTYIQQDPNIIRHLTKIEEKCLPVQESIKYLHVKKKKEKKKEETNIKKRSTKKEERTKKRTPSLQLWLDTKKKSNGIETGRYPWWKILGDHRK